MFIVPTSKIDPLTVISKKSLYYNVYAVLKTRPKKYKQGDILIDKNRKYIYIHDDLRFNKYEISITEIDGWYYVEKYNVWRSPKKCRDETL